MFCAVTLKAQLQMQNKGEGVVCGCDEEFSAARYLENGEIALKAYYYSRK